MVESDLRNSLLNPAIYGEGFGVAGLLHLERDDPRKFSGPLRSSGILGEACGVIELAGCKGELGEACIDGAPSHTETGESGCPSFHVPVNIAFV